MLGERRLRALAELGAELNDIGSAAELGRTAAEVLGRHRADVPLALIYLADASGQLALAGSTGSVPPAVDAVAQVLARVTADGTPATVEVADLVESPPVRRRRPGPSYCRSRRPTRRWAR